MSGLLWKADWQLLGASIGPADIKSLGDVRPVVDGQRFALDIFKVDAQQR